MKGLWTNSAPYSPRIGISISVCLYEYTVYYLCMAAMQFICWMQIFRQISVRESKFIVHSSLSCHAKFYRKLEWQMKGAACLVLMTANVGYCMVSHLVFHVCSTGTSQECCRILSLVRCIMKPLAGLGQFSTNTAGNIGQIHSNNPCEHEMRYHTTLLTTINILRRQLLVF